MILERNGIRLISLTEQYIELVRCKRNLPEVQSTMEYREYITAEMQETWFETINNINNQYFLIELNNAFIGLISAADIDWKKNIVNNGGIFIWEKNYLQSPEVVQSSILLTDFGFAIGLKKNYVRILKNNATAIAYNRSLGYQLLPGQEEVNNQKYELTDTWYLIATRKIRPLFSTNLKVTLTSFEYDNMDLAERLDREAGNSINVHVEVSII